jgi:hypothetical protein
MEKIPNTPQFRGGESLGRNASGASIGPALQRAGSTLSGIGGEMENRLLRLKKEENDAKLLEDRGEYEIGMAKFWAWTEQNQDTDQWEERLSSTFDEIEERITSKGGSNPYVDKHRGEMFTKQRAAGTVRTIAKGGMLKTQQIKQTYLNTSKRQALNGNYDGAIQTLRSLGETGLAHEATLEKEIIALEHEKVIGGFTGVSDEELSSTIKGLEKSKPKMMSKTDHVNLLRSMKSRERSMVLGELEKYSKKIEASPRPMSEETVRVLLEGSKVPKEDQERYVRGWQQSAVRAPLSGKDTLGYQKRLQDLRDYQNSDGYNVTDYVDKRNEILIDMEADGVRHRSPDMWGAMGRTSLESMERHHNAIQKAKESTTAKELSEHIGYMVEYDAKRQLYEAIDRGGGTDWWEGLFSGGDMGSKTSTLMENKFEEDMKKWLGSYDFNQPEAQIRKDMDRKIQQWFYNETRDKVVPRAGASAADLNSSMSKVATPLKGLNAAFVSEGQRAGVDPRFLAAISMFETANGTSSAFRNKNNAMGVSNSKGPIRFANTTASVARMARVLANTSGPYRNANTLKEIAAVYAPVGAGNDVHGTNHHWASGVAKHLKELGVEDPYSLTLIKR